MKAKAVPDADSPRKDIPQAGVAENTVIVDGRVLEIKPTKQKYVRNGTANFYRLLERMSVNDIVQIPAGSFGEGDDRDGDKALMDFLIAATDDAAFVTSHYDDFDVGQIMRIEEIFRRVNKFPGKEDDLKNAQTPLEKG